MNRRQDPRYGLLPLLERVGHFRLGVYPTRSKPVITTPKEKLRS